MLVVEPPSCDTVFLFLRLAPTYTGYIFTLYMTWFGEQGSLAVKFSPPTRDPGSILPRTICGLNLFLPCSEGFSPGSPGFLNPQKTNISKYQFGQDVGPAGKPLSYD